MPRHKPVSSKQRKAELQLKRAIKRGDVPAPPPQPKTLRGRKSRHTPIVGPGTSRTFDASSKRLQSTFLKVEPEFLERSRFIACTESLPRPLPAQAVLLDLQEIVVRASGRLLTCPKRPKWRFDMVKKEVEKNEEGAFLKWMNETDGHIATWRRPRTDDSGSPKASSNSGAAVPGVPGEKNISSKAFLSPTFYERNLEVWRQLWRVSEISQIILLLLDSRCPALHLPPSLQDYIVSLRPARPLILVLTKSDLVPASHIAAWSVWLRSRYPSTHLVKVKSYREQDESQEHKGQGQRKKFEPEIQQDDLKELVRALKAAHEELLTPPENIRNDVDKLKCWKPDVRQTVDWEAASMGGRAQVGQLVENSGENYITIGLLGQPNVGKSSLLNALFGTHKVKASRTPGKTKHFQTLFWTPDIRLVDCPGLVMPNFVPMELQVLCGILPISQIPSIPACIHYASTLLPLEHILNLMHPSHTSGILEDKRTWREERPSLQRTERTSRTWTAMDVLVAFAKDKGWVTAKAGRPDTNRAGNTLLRALAEGKIRWAFWPPNTSIAAIQCEGNGIWLGDTVKSDTHEEDGSDSEISDYETTDDGTPLDEESVSDQSPAESGFKAMGVETMGVGRFGALTLEDAMGRSEDGIGDPETDAPE